jgi:hypothetical protein
VNVSQLSLRSEKFDDDNDDDDDNDYGGGGDDDQVLQFVVDFDF